jgi:hypothetical protein
MEKGVISRERMEADRMSRLLPAHLRCVAYGRRRISIDMVEVECGMDLCGSGAGTSGLTNEISGVHAGLGRQPFRLRRGNEENL